MVEGVPAVFTAGARHAVITLSRKSGPSVALYQVGPDGAPQEVKQQKLWFYEFEQYPWLKRWKPLVAGATRLSDKK